MYHYGHDGSGGWLWMLPVMLVFLLLVGLVVWALLNANRSPGPPGRDAPSPEEVLAHRFARGEIDAAEYQERLEVLRRDTR